MAATVSFLFWNIRRALGTRFHESLRQLTRGEVDVFLFAEPPADDRLLLEAMNGGFGGTYQRVPSHSRRLMLFSRRRDAIWTDRFSDQAINRITAHELSIEDDLSILLIGAHLHSANNLGLAERSEWARILVSDLREIESDVGHRRTVLVGDLNMNPFDPGLVETTALHAVMSRSLVNSVQEMKARRDHPPFYNPMWSLMGDWTGSLTTDQPRVAGTFFHNNSQALASYFWQTFDQLLLRPDLMNSLTRLEILESDGHNRLVSRSGRPRRSAMSDHLPLRFDLDLLERTF